MKENRIIRKLVNDDFDAFLEIWARAYPGAVPDDFTEEVKRRKKEEWIETNNENGAINYHGCFQDHKLLGGLILYDFEMNLYSDNIIKCGGIGEVCVDLLHKKEYVSKDLMKFAHKHYYDRGYSLTCLYPFAPDFFFNQKRCLGKEKEIFRTYQFLI